MNMPGYRRGEVVLLSFPFTSGDEYRKRPALVLLDTGDEDLVVARITSQIVRTTFDVIITDWQGSGLLLPSIVRLDKLATLEKRLVERRLGELALDDSSRVEEVLRLFWQAN